MDVTIVDYSATELDDTLDVYLSRYSRRSSVIYGVLVVAVAAAIVALPLVRVQVSVGAAGILRPTVERQEVRAATSGIVERVAVRRGEAVARGDVLAMLAAAPLEDRAGTVARRLRDARASVVDLEGLLSGSLEWREAAVSTEELRRELVRLAAEVDEHDLEISLLRQESGRAWILAGGGLLPRREAEEQEHRLRRAIAAREALLARYRTEWAIRLAERTREAADLGAETSQLRSDIERHVILAAASGTVEELRVLSPGSVVQAGEVLAVISPDAPHVAEAYVPAREVGLLRVGSPARVHVDAFNYLDWGYLPAEITEISSDFLLVDEAPVFRVLLAIGTEPLRLPNGVTAQLRKGMTVQTRFLLAERSLLQLLRDDLSDWAHPWSAGDGA